MNYFRFLSGPKCSRPIDNASGQLFPIYDEVSGLYCLTGKGDSFIRFYELTFLNQMDSNNNNNNNEENDNNGGATFEKLCDNQSTQGGTFNGMCLMPAKSNDIRNVEVMKLLKLTTDAVYPLSFKVPRADHLKEFFQDDLYGLVKDTNSSYTINDWLDNMENLSCSFQPQLVSLKPDDMINLSEKPAASIDTTSSKMKNKTALFRQEIATRELENQTRDNEFSRLQRLAVQRAQYHPNASGVVNTPTSVMSPPPPPPPPPTVIRPSITNDSTNITSEIIMEEEENSMRSEIINVKSMTKSWAEQTRSGDNRQIRDEVPITSPNFSSVKTSWNAGNIFKNNQIIDNSKNPYANSKY